MHGIQHLDEGIGIDDPIATPFIVVVSRYHLGIFQVGVHTRILIKEPYTDQFRSFLGILLVTAEVPGKGKGGDALGGCPEAVTVQLVQFRVRFTVTADVGQSVRFGRVGPEIACLTHVVMLVSAAGCLLFHHDGQGLCVKRSFSIRYQFLISSRKVRLM